MFIPIVRRKLTPRWGLSEFRSFANSSHQFQPRHKSFQSMSSTVLKSGSRVGTNSRLVRSSSYVSAGSRGSRVGGTSAVLDKHHQHGDPQLTSVNPEVMALVEPQDHGRLQASGK